MKEANYFTHPYPSNSALTKLAGILNNVPEKELNEAFRIGTLFDAMVTEPEKVNWLTYRVLGRDEYTYTHADFQMCMKMRRRFLQTPWGQIATGIAMTRQKEIFVDALKLDYEGLDFSIPFKGKLDFSGKDIVIDLKSTSCTTQKEFENACMQFEYDRQMVAYCLIDNASKAIIVGVSKEKPHNVFHLPIKKGDEMWNRGYKRFAELAFKWKIIYGETKSNNDEAIHIGKDYRY